MFNFIKRNKLREQREQGLLMVYAFNQNKLNGILILKI